MIYKINLIIVFTLIFVQTTYSQNNSSNINFIDTNKLFSSYELDEFPQLVLGKDSLNKYINQYILKPILSKISDYGILTMCLVIDNTGDLLKLNISSEIDIINCDNEKHIFCDLFEELKRQINKWVPGKKNGINVKSIICFPIILKLN